MVIQNTHIYSVCSLLGKGIIEIIKIFTKKSLILQVHLIIIIIYTRTKQISAVAWLKIADYKHYFKKQRIRASKLLFCTSAWNSRRAIAWLGRVDHGLDLHQGSFQSFE